MILTEQEVDDIQLSLMRVKQHGVQNFARAIESAVLEKLKAQEPFAFHHDEEGLSYSNHYTRTVPLYAHPDPRVAELEAVLRECRETLIMLYTSAKFNIVNEAIAKIDAALNKG